MFTVANHDASVANHSDRQRFISKKRPNQIHSTLLIATVTIHYLLGQRADGLTFRLCATAFANDFLAVVPLKRRESVSDGGKQ